MTNTTMLEVSNDLINAVVNFDWSSNPAENLKALRELQSGLMAAINQHEKNKAFTNIGVLDVPGAFETIADEEGKQ